MAGEENEGAAARGFNERQCGGDHAVHIVRVGRIRQPGGQIEQTLSLIVERAVNPELRRAGKSQPAREMTEIIAHGKRRGSEYPRALARAHERLEALGDIKRQEGE